MFVGFTGGVTWLLFQRYFNQGGQSTETRSRASSASGAVEIKLVMEPGARRVKDTFTAKVMLNTKGKKISGLAFSLSYPSGSAAVPDLEILDSDGNANNGIQLKSFGPSIVTGKDANGQDVNCLGSSLEPAQVNLVNRPPGTGMRTTYIDFALTCISTTGYVSPDEGVQIAEITFKANAPGSFAITSDPRVAEAMDAATNTDILKTMDQTTIAVEADAVKPTVAIIEGIAEGQKTANNSVTFKIEGTELPARQSDTVKPANFLEYHYKFDNEAFSAWSTSTTISKVVLHGPRKLTVEARDLNGNVSLPVVRNFIADLVPTVEAITPNAAVANTEITITGFNFGTAKGGVTFGTVAVAAANIVEWTNTKIRVKVPPNAGNGIKITTVGSGAPASGVSEFTLQSKLDLVYTMQGITQNGGDRKVDVTLVAGTKKITLPNQVAKWDSAQSAYRVVTDHLGNDFAAGNWIISIKDGNHLRKKFPAVALAKGVSNPLVKKAATDGMKAGDFDGNNKINLTDFGAVIAVFKQSEVDVTQAIEKFDLNVDKKFNLRDVSIMLSNYTALEVPGDTE